MLKVYTLWFYFELVTYGNVCTALLEFILDDLRANFDLALAWMFAEYSCAENDLSTKKTQSYESYLLQLLNGARERLEPRDR